MRTKMFQTNRWNTFCDLNWYKIQIQMCRMQVWMCVCVFSLFVYAMRHVVFHFEVERCHKMFGLVFSVVFWYPSNKKTKITKTNAYLRRGIYCRLRYRIEISTIEMIMHDSERYGQCKYCMKMNTYTTLSLNMCVCVLVCVCGCAFSILKTSKVLSFQKRFSICSWFDMVLSTRRDSNIHIYIFKHSLNDSTAKKKTNYVCMHLFWWKCVTKKMKRNENNAR